jgi:hypothetical protein
MTEKPLNRGYFDFDNTICRASFNEQTGHYDMGEPIEMIAQAITDEYFNGREIYIFTARPKKEWGEVRNWLDKEGIPYKKVTNVKKPALYYVDDRNFRPDEFVIWSKTYGKRT